MYFLIFAWAIRLTSCFVYRVKYETLHPVWDETFDFIVSVDDVFDNRKLECEVWDRDPYGVRDYMGKVKVDLNPLLLRIKDLPPAPGRRTPRR